MTDEDLKQIKGFLDDSGKVSKFPSKIGKKLVVMRYIAENIDVNKTYTEKEINELLNSLTTFNDPCTLRRDLYNAHFLDREKDGSCYRRGSAE